MTKTRAISMASRIGILFAEELNGDPREAQNWSKLNANDDLPEFDYITLRAEFGNVTPEMERAYRDAFNDAFVGVAE